MVQWAGIRLSVQGTRVQSLVWEDSTGHRAGVSQLLSPHAAATEALTLASLLHKRRYCNEKPRNHNKEQPPLTATRESPCAAKKTQCQNKQRPQPKINKFKKIRKKSNVEPPLTVFPSSRSFNSWGFVTGPMSL